MRGILTSVLLIAVLGAGVTLIVRHKIQSDKAFREHATQVLTENGAVKQPDGSFTAGESVFTLRGHTLQVKKGDFALNLKKISDPPLKLLASKETGRTVTLNNGYAAQIVAEAGCGCCTWFYLRQWDADNVMVTNQKLGQVCLDIPQAKTYLQSLEKIFRAGNPGNVEMSPGVLK